MEPLIEALGDGAGVVRAEAARALGELKDPAVRIPFDPVAERRSGGGWGEAVWALGKLKDPQAVEPLLSVLSDKKWSVRREAASALGDINDPRAAAFLTKAMQGENLEVVAGAHAFFIARGESGTEAVLIQALESLRVY